MEDRVTLNAAEQRRVVVLNHFISGATTLAETAELLRLSERQVRRLAATCARGEPELLAARCP